VSDEFRALRRSRSDRVVAGVLGGLGRRLDIDPVVLRIVTVVLAIFGGVGVLLYAAAWLLVPAEDEDGSVLDHALGRNEEHRSGAVPLAIVLAVVSVISASGIIAGSWDSGVLILLAGIGLVALMRRRDDATPSAEPAAQPEQAWFDHLGTAGPGPVSPPTTSAPTTGAPPGGEPADPSAPEPSASGHTLADIPATGWPEGPDWGAARAPAPEPPGPAGPTGPSAPSEPSAPRPKQRSVLGPITVCLALLAVGLLAVNDVYWAPVPIPMYFAVALGVVALGLLVGAWFGRSRWLIVLGILLTPALVVTTWADEWDFSEAGNVSYRYTSIDQMPRSRVAHSAGDITYDLSALAMTDADAVSLDLDVGAGNVTVTVPPTADVTVNASIGGGNYTIFGDEFSGLGGEVSDEYLGPDGRGGGEIVLNVDLGMGDLEVTR